MAPLATHGGATAAVANIWNIIQIAVSSLARWLTMMAASVAWQLWHGTGLDHLCQIILHILKILAISVGIVMLAPCALLIAYKLSIFVWTCVLPLGVKGVKSLSDCLQRRRTPARSTRRLEPPVSRKGQGLDRQPNSQQIDRVTTWLLATSDARPPTRFTPCGYGTCPYVGGNDRPPPYEVSGPAGPVFYAAGVAGSSVSGHQVAAPMATVEGSRDGMAAMSTVSITSTLPPYSYQDPVIAHCL